MSVTYLTAFEVCASYATVHVVVNMGTSEGSPAFWSGIHNPDPATATLSVARRWHSRPILC